MGAEGRTRVTLWFVIAAAVLAFGQAIHGQGYLGPAILGMLLASAGVAGVRRLGGGAVVTVALSTAALVWYLGLVFRAPLTRWTIPTPAVLRELWETVALAYGHSLIDYAPVPLREGYAVMIVGAVWLATLAAELATFRFKKPLLAVAIPLVMFSFAMVVGTGEGSPALVVLFLGTLFAYWSSESVQRLRSWGRWLDPGAASGALARRLGAGCLAAAFVAPLFLPAIGEGMISWRTGSGQGPGGGSGDGASLNPWVSIVPRLIQQSDEEMFRVEAAETTYWRTASLEFFDGTAWRENALDRFPAVAGRIVGEQDVPPRRADRRATLVHRIGITGLRGQSLPAAPTPTQAVRLGDGEADTGGLHFDPQSGAVYVAGGLEEGEVYRVTSDVPRISYEELNETAPPPGGHQLISYYRGGPVRQTLNLEASDDGAGAVRLPDIYYQLPALLSSDVVRLTRRWTRNQATALERLVEIQRRLRSFTYTLNPEQAADHDHLRRFLMETRAGYCQQFATAFAVMARILDLPARVSVGFLPGSQHPATGIYSVRGTDAHAWPEVYFEDVGWVAFEPTPREAYAAPAYTAPTPRGGAGARSGQAGEARPRPADPGREAARGREGLAGDGRQAGDGAAGSRNAPDVGAPWQNYFRVLASVLALGIALILIATPLLKEARDRRRYRRAADTRMQTEAAFLEFQRHAAELAQPRRPDETARSYLLRLAENKAVDLGAALRLATIYESASYSAARPEEDVAEEARGLVKAMRPQLWARANWWARGQHVFSPRPGGSV